MPSRKIEHGEISLFLTPEDRCLSMYIDTEDGVQDEHAIPFTDLVDWAKEWAAGYGHEDNDEGVVRCKKIFRDMFLNAAKSMMEGVEE